MAVKILPMAITMTPIYTKAIVDLLKFLKNLGPAIRPTAATNIAVPILENMLNLDFMASSKSTIVVSPIVNSGTLLTKIP